MSTMRVLSLFSGIGAHDLGLEWAGMEIVGQVEIDEYCQTILKKHWPKVKRWTDITSVPINDLRRLKPDLITGGFPCQDISTAGKQKGIVEGDRSSLWREMWRIIRDVRPRWVLIENVPALRTKGADSVLSGLEALNYSRWPLVVGSIHTGAPHRRQRVLIVGYSEGEREREQTNKTNAIPAGGEARHEPIHPSQSAGDSQLDGRLWTSLSAVGWEDLAAATGAGAFVPDADGYPIWIESGWQCGSSGAEARFAFPSGPGEAQFDWEERRTIKPEVDSATDGTARRLALKALGNANPPQVFAMLGRAIINTDLLLSC